MKFQPVILSPEETELEPDLEWMLQSGQIPADVLAAELIRAHFQELYHWMLLVLDDPEPAAFASLEAILAAANRAYRYPGGISSQVWVFQQAVGLARQFLRERRRRRLWDGLTSLFRQSAPAGSEPETRLDAAIWLALDQLNDPARLAANLSWGLGLAPETAAQIVEQSGPEFTGLLDLTHRRVLAGLALFDLNEGDLPGQELSLTLAQSLERRYAQFQAGPLEIEPLIGETIQEVKRQSGRQSWSIRLKEFAWLGAVLVLILGSFWVINRLLPEPEPTGPASPSPRATQPPASALQPADESLLMNYYPQAGETLGEIGGLLNLPAAEIERLGNLYPEDDLVVDSPLVIELNPAGNLPRPTPVIPIAHRLPPLTDQSSPQQIRNMLNLSQTHWKTLWLDAVYFDYGPEGYVGSPHLSRIQSWLSQPDKSLTITWISGSDTTYAVLKRDGLAYTSYQLGTIEVRKDESFIPNQTLALDMVTPGRSTIFSRPSQIQALGEDTVAGRPAVMVDWLTTTGRAVWPDRYRMWIDSQTGLILRFQFFSGQERDTLLGEVILARLDLDVDFPQADLFDPRRLPEQVFASDFSGAQVDADVLPVMTPTPEASRQSQTRIPPPPGFDPAASRLTFQYESGLQPTTRLSPVAVFADQYFLGEIMLTDPWSVHCARSPDGRKIAYTYNPNGKPREAAGWFDLKAPLHVMSAGLGQSFGRFTFSPDSRRLAIFGKEHAGQPGSLYIIDTETTQLHYLIDLDNAKSLVWSEDGSQIALLAGNHDWSRMTSQTLDADSGEQFFIGDVVSDLLWDDVLRSPDWPAPGWPARNWAAMFSHVEWGLSACTQPPGS